MKRVSIIITGLLMLLAVALPAVAGPAFPEVIPLPDGFFPEGIAIGPGHTFYTGSLIDGTIQTGDLSTGESQVLVPGQEGRIAVGMSFDARSGYLFVAGGGPALDPAISPEVRVYDTGSGDLLAEYPIDGGFINDVVVTKKAVYITDSFAPVIYRVPLGPSGALPDPTDVEAIPLTGDWEQVGGFNANGIEATLNGKALIVVNSATGAVYRVNPESGVATEIDLGGEAVPGGDGLVLLGKTLYVVQGSAGIGVISLSSDLSTGTLGEPIIVPDSVTPTTAAVFGAWLYVVDAKFPFFGDPTVPFQITKVSR